MYHFAHVGRAVLIIATADVSRFPHFKL